MVTREKSKIQKKYKIWINSKQPQGEERRMKEIALYRKDPQAQTKLKEGSNSSQA